MPAEARKQPRPSTKRAPRRRADVEGRCGEGEHDGGIARPPAMVHASAARDRRAARNRFPQRRGDDHDAGQRLREREAPGADEAERADVGAEEVQRRDGEHDRGGERHQRERADRTATAAA